ncbi:MAG TPA: hypothetical protein VIX63_15010 [Vicinamibacterales bacterium]
MVRLKITRQPSGSIDGIQLDDFIVGFTYDVGTMLGCCLLAERLAVPVDDDSPALVTPVRRQVRFDVGSPSHGEKVVPIKESRLRGRTPDELSEAADTPRRQRRRR